MGPAADVIAPSLLGDPVALAAAIEALDLDGARLALKRLRLHDRLLAREGFYHLFPDETRVWEGGRTQVFKKGRGEIIYARRLYPKILAFFAAGLTYRERCLLAANRVGKTMAGGYEDACHATGLYPPWWPGKVFPRPTSGWICGRTNETTRDILQAKLFGKIAYRDGRKTVDGSGIFPANTIGQPTWKAGVQDLIDTIPILHKSGGWSDIGMKSYEQGPKAFEGTEKDYIHYDEEPSAEVVAEGLVRTTTVGGITFLTFTPKEGHSTVVNGFLPKPEGVLDLDDGGEPTNWYPGPSEEEQPEGGENA